MVDFGCKYCGSTNIVRYGQVGGVQYWWCKECERKFADNDAIVGMKTPLKQVSSALGMYYRGMSIDEIRQQLNQQEGNYPSYSTVYDWITRFTGEAVNKLRDYKPNVGDVWIADETVLDVGGHKVWFWDLLDIKTRFLLSSHMSFNRTAQHARTLVEKASKRAGKVPKVIITDKLWAYLDGIELAFGADTQHVQSKGFTVQPNTNLIERFHGTLKSRTKVMRGLKTQETALGILDGWLVYYNFFRPHESLGNKTPAEKAGLNVPIKNWLDVVKQSHTERVSKPVRVRVDIGRPTRYAIRGKRKRKGVKSKRMREKPTPMLAQVRMPKK